MMKNYYSILLTIAFVASCSAVYSNETELILHGSYNVCPLPLPRLELTRFLEPTVNHVQQRRPLELPSKVTLPIANNIPETTKSSQEIDEEIHDASMKVARFVVQILLLLFAFSIVKVRAEREEVEVQRAREVPLRYWGNLPVHVMYRNVEEIRRRRDLEASEC